MLGNLNSGISHVMGLLASEESRCTGRKIHSNAPFIYAYEKMDLDNIDKLENSVIALNYVTDFLTVGKEISFQKMKIFLSVAFSDRKNNSIFFTASGVFPVDPHFIKYCDFFVESVVMENNQVFFMISDLHTLDTQDFVMDLSIEDKILSYGFEEEI